MRDVYQKVTDRIVAELERGAGPWVRPWSVTSGANIPCNAVTNRPYSGVNVLLFWLAADRGWPTPRFLTYKQAAEEGGHVRKGEHGQQIVFMKPITVKNRDPDPEADETKSFNLMREYTVFNVAQCDDLPEHVVAGKRQRVRNPDTRDELADAFVAETGAVIREGADCAGYVPSQDMILLPRFEAFKGADQFYGTTFHELTHWTGAPKRLDRKLENRFGSHAYAVEELIAELGAAFLSAEWAFDGHSQSASYIQGWIKLMKEDKRAIFTAASAAQKAVTFLRDAAMEEEDAKRSEESRPVREYEAAMQKREAA